MDVYLL